LPDLEGLLTTKIVADGIRVSADVSDLRRGIYPLQALSPNDMGRKHRALKYIKKIR